MANKKSYFYNEHELFVGKIFTDKNGFEWKIIWCGPQRVKAILVDDSTYIPRYTAHWHFIENIILRGYTTVDRKK